MSVPLKIKMGHGGKGPAVFEPDRCCEVLHGDVDISSKVRRISMNCVAGDLIRVSLEMYPSVLVIDPAMADVYPFPFHFWNMLHKHLQTIEQDVGVIGSAGALKAVNAIRDLLKPYEEHVGEFK